MKIQFERTIDIMPGYDKRSQDEGVHGCEIIFVLRGPHGVVTFACFTDWFPKITQEDATRGLGFRRLTTGVQPTPLEFAFHSPRLTDTVRSDKRTDCPYLPRSCHSSYSPNTAAFLRDLLLSNGSIGVWLELERRYFSAAKVTQTATKRKIQ